MNQFMLFAVIAMLLSLGQGAPPISTRETTSIESFKTHFNDIMALISKEEIQNITYEHLKTDEEFKAAIQYMQSKEWLDLIETIRGKSEWIALKKFLKDTSIDVDVGIKCIERLFENVTLHLEPQIPPPKKSLKLFLIDVEQSLPSMKILNYLQEQVTKGVNFNVLFDRLSSDESRQLVQSVLALPEIKRVLKELADMGVNLLDVLSLMYMHFGWGEMAF
ncbi:hypothetical protein NQ314_007549 [Rhamnusium bicolor]|uniref:Uncharacterized protein n=1 Tax=Rhamnusium bicolor TaxID=1586634 RepID=A0AAV8YM78_9CUCU|nr:hypothetical protein NQ314_007549 [Rhamnusium bicolor]